MWLPGAIEDSYWDNPACAAPAREFLNKNEESCWLCLCMTQLHAGKNKIVCGSAGE